MKDELVKEAEILGINASMYYMLPPQHRETALKADTRKENVRRDNQNGK